MPSFFQQLSFITLTLAFVFNSQAQNIEIALQGKRFAQHQAASPQQSVLTVPSSLQIKLGQHYQFKQTSSTLYPGGIEFRFLTLGNAQGARVFDLLGWRAGIEADSIEGKSARELRAEAFFFDPQLLLSTAKDLQVIATPTEWQDRYQFQSFIDQAARAATMVIDKQTRNIISARSANFTYLYGADNANPNSEQRSPQLTVKLGDTIVAQWDSVKLSALPAHSATEFVAPEGYQDRAANHGLRVEKLAEGTYRINGSASGYHLHFVVGDNSIAVFDAPVFPNEIAQIKTLIEATAPGKTISHIVLSHTHRDHIGGSPQLLNDNVQILTGQDGKLAIGRQLGEKLKAHAIEIITPVSIDLGQRSIRVIPLPSSHASEMLIAYDRQSNTLFQGDFFMMPEAGPTPVGFTVNRELAQALQQFSLTPERIVSVHGRLGTLAELAQTVQKLDESEVK